MTGPLAVFMDSAHCDTKHEHLVHVVTDGQTAYAWGPVTDCPAATRSGVAIHVPCGQPDPRTQETCHGQVTVLLTEDAWTADPNTVRLLSHGQPLDQEETTLTADPLASLELHVTGAARAVLLSLGNSTMRGNGAMAVWGVLVDLPDDEALELARSIAASDNVTAYATPF